MKISNFLAAILLLLVATPSARADYAADVKLLRKFEPVLKTNDVAAARKLVAAPNFRPMMRYGDEFYTIFDQALFNDQIEIARLMMKSNGWKRTKWNKNNTAQPLLTSARQPKLLPILQELSRQKGFDINVHYPGEGDFPLAYAAEADNMSALKWLVRQPRIKLNNRDGWGRTALFYAGTPATKYLLSLHKMNVNLRDNIGRTPLHIAVENGKVSKVRLLLQAPNIDPNIRDDVNNASTPLDAALADNNPEIASALMASPKVRTTAAQRASLKRFGKWTPQGDREGL